MSLTVRGMALDGRAEVEVSWYPPGIERYRARPRNLRGLVGDEELIRRAIVDELDGRTFRATATGPFFRADLDDAHAAVLQLGSYFRWGSYEITGEWPRIVSPVGEDAVA
ncbi:MAG TPA: hypothetical protein VMK83_11350 [Gaiellaceae bacterium]|nr:hypothetical protein [Gaiellaceae bacterium]